MDGEAIVIVPRPYQSAAVDAVWERLAVRQERATLIVLPTGTGKTVAFGLLAQRWSRDQRGRILILAHREELITQAAAEIAGIAGFHPAIEMAENRAVASTAVLPGWELPPVVVGSVPTMCQPGRLANWPRDEFSLVVTDEAHHGTANSYKRIYEHFAGAKMLGVTATPTRADKVRLGDTFNSVAFEMGIAEAVDEGWLVPVEQRFVVVRDMDLSRVRTHGGDFAPGELAEVLTGDRVLDRMVGATVEMCGDEPTLIFTAPRAPGDTVSQGEVFADAINKIRPGRAVFLSGETDGVVRRDELKRFESGDRQYLVGCALFTEGFNQPKISRIVMAQPTKSVVRYTQSIGRGTRTLRGVLDGRDTPDDRKAAIAASAKPSVLVLDFVGNSGRHKLISSVDIFAGKASAEAVARVKRKLERNPDQLPQMRNVQDMLDAAEREIEKEREDRERAKAKREELARLKIERLEYSATAVNPFEYDSGVAGRATGSASKGPATQTQLDWIKNHGGIVIERMTSAEAGAAIADVKRRWKEKLCSPKQERTLKRLGLASGPVPKVHAAALLDYANATNWQPRGRPTREELAILRSEQGFRLGVKVRGDFVPVGATFPGEDAVRQAYRELPA